MKRFSLVLASLLMAFTFSSCVFVAGEYALEVGGSINVNNTYIDSEYTVNESVSDIKINWINGSVCLSYNDDNCIKIIERTKRVISSSEQVDYYVDGGVLYINYARTNRVHSSLDKYLAVSIPRNILLGAISCSTVSGDILLENMQAISIACSSTSGSISCSIPGNCEIFTASSTSGSINVAADYIEEFSISSVSGSVNYAVNFMSDEGYIETTSGSIDVKFPSNDGFCASIYNVSGSFISEFPMSRRGNLYTYKNQDRYYTFETVSGSISLRHLR